MVGARRTSRLEALASELGERVIPLALDVSDPASSARFVQDALGNCGAPHILVNNAGLARGLASVVDADEADWREMLEANVMGLMRMTRAFLPSMLERGSGDLVQISSVAGVQPYPKGAAYCATKAAVDAFSFALRRELIGTGLRQLVIQPGMVETEFSEVRFHGDTERASEVYRGVQPLGAQDVADAVYFAVTRPAHVSIQTMLIMPTAQVTATETARSAGLLARAMCSPAKGRGERGESELVRRRVADGQVPPPPTARHRFRGERVGGREHARR